MMASPCNGSSTTQQNEICNYPIKPRSKRAKYISILVSSFAAIATVTFLIVAEEGKEKYYLWLFPSLLGLFSVFAGALISRMCLLFEEYRHRHSRHNGSFKNVLKFCFKGIHYGTIGALMGLLIVFLVVCITSDLVELDYKHGAILFSGVGIGPLILQVLNLDTLPAVRIETVLEDQQAYVANVLAWYYYHNYLKETLPKIPVWIREAGLQKKLSTTKLVILIPLDCDTAVEISTVDPRHFEKESSLKLKNRHGINLHLYKVKSSSGKDYYLMIQLAKIPLDTLDYMSKHAGILSVNKKSRLDEIKLFYQTLTWILEDCESDYRHRCLLVTYNTKAVSSRNGSLANKIVQLVNSETFSNAEDEVYGQQESKYGRVACRKMENKSSTSTMGDVGNNACENSDHESIKCNVSDDMAASRSLSEVFLLLASPEISGSPADITTLDTRIQKSGDLTHYQ